VLSLYYVSVLKLAIFWDIAPCSPYMKRRFGGTYHLNLQGQKSVVQATSYANHLLHAGILLG
jgi:hypothetical protein